MDLSIYSSDGSTGAKDIYINKVKIISAEDISNQEIFGQRFDMAIETVLDIGKDFFPVFTLYGNFKRDADVGITSWGTAFRIKNFFSKLGVRSNRGCFTDELTIPQEWLTEIIGKEFYKLSYVSGTKEEGGLKYSNWSEISTNTPEELKSRFLKSFTEKGYPKNYQPDLINSQQESLTQIPIHTTEEDKDFF